MSIVCIRLKSTASSDTSENHQRSNDLYGIKISSHHCSHADFVYIATQYRGARLADKYMVSQQTTKKIGTPNVEKAEGLE